MFIGFKKKQNTFRVSKADICIQFILAFYMPIVVINLESVWKSRKVSFEIWELVKSLKFQKKETVCDQNLHFVLHSPLFLHLSFNYF